jgi:ribosome-associated protein
VVHVFHKEARDYYGLDGLWKDCPEIEFVDQTDAERAARNAEVGESDGEGDE